MSVQRKQEHDRCSTAVNSVKQAQKLCVLQCLEKFQFLSTVTYEISRREGRLSMSTLSVNVNVMGILGCARCTLFFIS